MKLRPIWKTVRECTTYATVPTVIAVAVMVVAGYIQLAFHPSKFLAASTAENIVMLLVGPIGGALVYSILVAVVLLLVAFPLTVLLRVLHADHILVVIVLGLFLGGVLSDRQNMALLLAGAILGGISAALSWLIINKDQRLTPHSKADAP